MVYKPKYGIFLAYLLVDLFAAMETTFMTITAPEIAKNFSLDVSYVSLIVNSFLYPVFIALVVLLFTYRFFQHKIQAKKFFIEGLLYFMVGSLICYFADSFQLFLFGRVIQGIGAAMAFLGQLWTMSESFKEEIAKPLAWAQSGFALGLVFGPIAGGLTQQFISNGWRTIFFANFVICLAIAILFSQFYENQTSSVESTEKYSIGQLDRNFKIAVYCEGIFSLVIIAIEFIISIYFQTDQGFSPLATAGAILVPSAGIIAGSIWAAEKKEPDFATMLLRGFQILLIIIIALGLAVKFNFLVMTLATLFLAGLAVGYISVASYAFVVSTLSSKILVSGIIIYLISMHLGTALGVQIENIWHALGNDFLIITLLLVFLLHTAVFMAEKLLKSESRLLEPKI